MYNISFCRKLFLIILVGFLVIESTHAQNSFFGKAYFGSSSAALMTGSDYIGGPSYDVEKFREFGLLFGKELNGKWAVETGVNIAAANVIVRSGPGPEINVTRYKFEMLSFPVIVKYSISSFLYVNGGPLLDIQRSEKSTINQSGIGYLIGIGAQQYFNNVGIYLNPHLKRHAAISFDSSIENLTELGVQLGVAYKF